MNPHGAEHLKDLLIGQNVKDIAELAKTVDRTNDIVQAYIQTLMREGRVPI